MKLPQRARALLPPALPCLLLVGLVPAMAGPAAASAQEASLTYTQTTTAELGGFLGRVVRLAGGQMEPVEESVYVLGNRMRTDHENTSSILDLEERRWLMLNHPQRQYLTLGFDEMAEWHEAMLLAAEDAEAREAMEEAQREMDEAGVEVDVRFSTERTGARETILGAEAEQVFVTLEIETRGAPVEGEMVEEEFEGGTMVLLIEVWSAPRVPGFEALEALQEAMAREVAETDFFGTGSSLGSLAEVFAQDPRIGVAFQEGEAALEDLQGIALRTTSWFAILPPGLPVDREMILAEADRGITDVAREAAAEAAAEAAREAAREGARAAVGRLSRGLRGRDREPDPEPAEAEAEEWEPRPSVFLKTVTEITAIGSEPVSAALFQVPEGYTRMEMPDAEEVASPGR